MNDSYLRGCHRGNDALCPIFRLGDIVHQAREDFAVLAVEVGLMVKLGLVEEMTLALEVDLFLVVELGVTIAVFQYPYFLEYTQS